MRILMLCYEFPPLGGGASKVAHGLSKELVRLAHQVDLVTMAYRGLPESEWVDGVRVFRVPCIRTRRHACSLPEAGSYLIPVIRKVRRLVRTKHYDINHTHFILPDGLIAWLAQKFADLPYIITAHGSDVPGYNPDRLKITHKVVAPVWKEITRNAAQVVCPSLILKSLASKRMENSKIVLIPNGFDYNRFQPHGEKVKRILIVTRMFKRKGVQYLLKSLEDLVLDYEVHIVGDGPYLPTLKRMAGNIKAPLRFWGWLDNQSPILKELYEASKIFVLASEEENFPIALLEAMASELAIITTKGTGCAEVVGDTAVLVEPRNSKMIRSALKKLTRDTSLCARLGKAARRRVKTNFSWDIVAKRYVEQYLKHAQFAGSRRPKAER
jgi:glycosyltransferase involved in cell wall biosynthesis